MIFLVIFLIATCLVLAYKLFAYKTSLKNLNDELLFISKNDTNKELPALSSKELTVLSENINLLLKKCKNDNLKVKNIQSTLNRTLISISHDLRTPLTSINGYTQMLLKDDTLSKKQLEHINIIKGRVTVVQKMVDLLFEYIRLENNELKLNIELINVDDILRDVLALYYYDYVKKCEPLEPIIIIPEKTLSVFGDKNALTRVFNNIIYNSLIHGEKDYKISLIENPNFIEITFSNYVSNMSLNDVSMIFDRFFTCDRSKTKGTTGLGLCISKMLVDKMNGSINATLENNIFSINIKFHKKC